jgi:HPt (histidine-containing phosphotransfer) domain-containing protein
MSDYAQTLHCIFEVPEGLPLLDPEQIALLKSAGEGLLEELIDTFEAECAPRLQQLQTECAAAALPDIRTSVHFLAGSAANIGLLRFAELCRAIENQIIEERLSAFEAIYPTVATEYAYGMAELLES